ncbi:hypothetical protein Pst134EA_032059 [Puccinia striiformis f. sp. tritici]|uniref:uncharacterized protein n=1 Tax=Puccinia striiformis f. sp. tritici TaxID=168172 RepID=UPI00200781C1|nr:uncharacterized protein Pst134EA_032059 [Puccinia striiformis f. sp. tritici]KAH9441928.1 hypothetical protein Pst134EA_032059 [Puccinia striiformis f. sp. tritici]
MVTAWFRLVIKAQHAALVQSETDRRAARDAAEANATRIARLEDLVLALAVKSEEPPRRTCLGDDELDLQNFCTSDGPKFFGPPMKVEPFVKWVSGLQIFFTTKNVNRASDKIEIIGGLIDDSNLLKFYANEASNYLTGSWEAFKTRMFQVALPLNWRMELRKQIHQITMSPTESFMDYSTRARTLQTLANDVAAAARLLTATWPNSSYLVYLKTSRTGSPNTKSWRRLHLSTAILNNGLTRLLQRQGATQSHPPTPEPVEHLIGQQGRLHLACSCLAGLRGNVISARRPVGTPLELARSIDKKFIPIPTLSSLPQTSELHPTEAWTNASTARPIYSSTSRLSFCPSSNSSWGI